MTTILPAPAGTPLTPRVADAARTLDGAPTYVYDLAHLDTHVAAIRAALHAVAGPAIELIHAVKANPDPGLLRVIARHVDGLEVASGGELAHVRREVPEARLAFGGPGKTDQELTDALAAGVDRFHVESLTELRRLDVAARAAGVRAKVLLRVNIATSDVVAVGQVGVGSLSAGDVGEVAGGATTDVGSGSGRVGDAVEVTAAGVAGGQVAVGAALTMGGRPSPFGMDPIEAAACAVLLDSLPGVEFAGVHAHLASGLDARPCAEQGVAILRWAVAFARRHGLALGEVNIGGGMAVDYHHPDQLFDWSDYAHHLITTAREATDGAPLPLLRIEPGRAISAYSGWYATEVLDLKQSHGEWFAICAGGTHHLRTPAAKSHAQPLAVLPVEQWDRPWDRPACGSQDEVTFVGQLCTPKDVLAAATRPGRVRVGDKVVFAMAGAYAHNISHVDFLMHPRPDVVHVGAGELDLA